MGVGQLVISTSTTRPSRFVVGGGGRSLRAQHAVRRGGFGGGGQLLALGNENVLGHALVEGNDTVAQRRSERA